MIDPEGQPGTIMNPISKLFNIFESGTAGSSNQALTDKSKVK